jgi:KDO2-lipid IV(A) lauroyltransferase
MRGRRAQVERNVARISGTGLAPRVRDAIVRETFTSYARYWVESFRLPGTSADALAEGVTSEGMEAVAAAMEAGTGLVVALPHLGGWEWAAFWLAEVHGWPVTAVAEPIEPPELAEWFLDLRAKLGMEIVPLGAGAGAACVRALKENRIVCLVCDRDLAGDGIAVPFLGEVTTLPAGPATLALRSGAPLVTAATYFEGRRHRFVVEPPLDTTRHGRLRDDVERVTAAVAERMEQSIRSAPEQWHLLQPNWPSDRS